MNMNDNPIMSSNHHVEASSQDLSAANDVHQCPDFHITSTGEVDYAPKFHMPIFDDNPAAAAKTLRDILKTDDFELFNSFIHAIPRAHALTAAQFEVLRGSGFLLALADALIKVISKGQCSRYSPDETRRISCAEVSMSGSDPASYMLTHGTLLFPSTSSRLLVFSLRTTQHIYTVYRSMTTLGYSATASQKSASASGITRRHFSIPSSCVERQDTWNRFPRSPIVSKGSIAIISKP